MDVKTAAFLILQIVLVVAVTCKAEEDEEDIAVANGGFKSSSDDDLSDLGVELPVNVLFPGLVPVDKRARDYGYTEFTADEAEAIVDRHNFDRAKAKPSASNMRHMTWDNDLATMSQNWADGCVYEHGGMDGSANISPYTSIGQNLAVGTRSNSQSGVVATDLWHDEESFYDYYTGGCTPGEMCGHYTQIVWADSYKVGCGRKLCTQISIYGRYWKNAYYIVCDYAPAGNIIGDKPFKTGDRCSDCPSDAAFCTSDNLCRDCTKASNKAQCGTCNRVCQNCGTLDQETCTCQCAPGWTGGSCTEPCADHHEWCGVNPGWGSSALCENYVYEAAVRKYCLKMCGICQAEDPYFVCGGPSRPRPEPECTDNNEDCPGWAASGECDVNPDWMLSNCKKSCQVCGGGDGGIGGEPEPDKEPILKNVKYCKTSFTATSVIDENLYVFKKDKYWGFDDIKLGALQSSAAGSLVREVWPKVNPDVRAVYQRPDAKVVFFRGTKYWLYTEQSTGWTRDAGYPKSISQTFPGMPTPSAAVYDFIEDRTYIFSGGNFWRFDESKQRFDMEGEPISSRFNGVPSKITGAFIDHNEDFILVKGKDFWKVKRGQRKVAKTEPSNLSQKYLDCYE